MPALIRFDFGRRGFSSRPVTLPSFTSTTPNDCGLETSARAITGARTFPWWAIIAASASPETTTSPFTLRNDPVTWDRMHPIAWAVPSRSVCSSYVIERPSASPSPRLSRSRTRNRRSEEHTSELQSLAYLVCRLLLEKKKKTTTLTVRSEENTTEIQSIAYIVYRVLVDKTKCNDNHTINAYKIQRMRWTASLTRDTHV